MLPPMLCSHFSALLELFAARDPINDSVLLETLVARLLEHHILLGFLNSWGCSPPPPLSLNECIPLSCGISWWLGLLGPLQGRAVCTSRGVGRGGVSASRSWGWEPGERKASGFKGHLKQAQSLTQPEFIGVIRWGQVPQGNCGMPHNKREKGSGLHKVWVPS